MSGNNALDVEESIIASNILFRYDKNDYMQQAIEQMQDSEITRSSYKTHNVPVNWKNDSAKSSKKKILNVKLPKTVMETPKTKVCSWLNKVPFTEAHLNSMRATSHIEKEPNQRCCIIERFDKTSSGLLVNEKSSHSQNSSTGVSEVISSKSIRTSLDSNDSKKKKGIVEPPLSPQSQKKSELCSYLKLMDMKTTDNKHGCIYSNRRSTRVKNLIKLSEQRKLEIQLNSEVSAALSHMSFKHLDIDEPIIDTMEELEKRLIYSKHYTTKPIEEKHVEDEFMSEGVSTPNTYRSNMDDALSSPIRKIPSSLERKWTENSIFNCSFDATYLPLLETEDFEESVSPLIPEEHKHINSFSKFHEVLSNKLNNVVKSKNNNTNMIFPNGKVKEPKSLHIADKLSNIKIVETKKESLKNEQKSNLQKTKHAVQKGRELRRATRSLKILRSNKSPTKETRKIKNDGHKMKRNTKNSEKQSGIKRNALTIGRPTKLRKLISDIKNIFNSPKKRRARKSGRNMKSREDKNLIEAESKVVIPNKLKVVLADVLKIDEILPNPTDIELNVDIKGLNSSSTNIDLNKNKQSKPIKTLVKRNISKIDDLKDLRKARATLLKTIFKSTKIKTKRNKKRRNRKSTNAESENSSDVSKMFLATDFDSSGSYIKMDDSLETDLLKNSNVPSLKSNKLKLDTVEKHKILTEMEEVTSNIVELTDKFEVNKKQLPNNKKDCNKLVIIKRATGKNLTSHLHISTANKIVNNGECTTKPGKVGRPRKIQIKPNLISNTFDSFEDTNKIEQNAPILRRSNTIHPKIIIKENNSNFMEISRKSNDHEATENIAIIAENVPVSSNNIQPTRKENAKTTLIEHNYTITDPPSKLLVSNKSVITKLNKSSVIRENIRVSKPSISNKCHIEQASLGVNPIPISRSPKEPELDSIIPIPSISTVNTDARHVYSIQNKVVDNELENPRLPTPGSPIKTLPSVIVSRIFSDNYIVEPLERIATSPVRSLENNLEISLDPVVETPILALDPVIEPRSLVGISEREFDTYAMKVLNNGALINIISCETPIPSQEKPLSRSTAPESSNMLFDKKLQNNSAIIKIIKCGTSSSSQEKLVMRSAGPEASNKLFDKKLQNNGALINIIGCETPSSSQEKKLTRSAAPESSKKLFDKKLRGNTIRIIRKARKTDGKVNIKDIFKTNKKSHKKDAQVLGIRELLGSFDSLQMETKKGVSDSNKIHVRTDLTDPNYFNDAKHSKEPETVDVDLTETLINGNIVADQNPVKYDFVPPSSGEPRSLHKILELNAARKNTKSDTNANVTVTWEPDEAGKSCESSPSTKVKKLTHLIGINEENGRVLYTYYLDYNLVIAQELGISFWVQSPLGNVLGAQDMWIPKGCVPRLSLGNGCVHKESKESVIVTDHSFAYVELWTKEHKSDYRQMPVADVFAVVYYWKNKVGMDKKVLQLENINGFADDVKFVVLKNSSKILVSWRVIKNDVRTSIVHCYQLANDYKTVQCIKVMESVEHMIVSLHNIGDSNGLVMGSGDHKITIWNLEYGYIVATVDIASDNLPAPETVWVKCDRGFIFTLQKYADGILRMVAINGMKQSSKKLQMYKSPDGYESLQGVCVTDGILITFYSNGVIAWNIQSGDLILEELTHDTKFLPSEDHVVTFTEDCISVRNALSYIITNYDYTDM